MPVGTGIRLSDWDYKTVFAVNEVADLCIAGNQLFGWILIDITRPPPGNNEQMLTFGRESMPGESPNMVRLNKRLDSCVTQVNTLNHLKAWAPFRIAAPIYAIFRNLSKNIDKRKTELEAYERLLKMPKEFITLQKLRIKQGKTHKFFRCECGAILRVPKGRGKIEVTCPKCKLHTFRKT